MKKKQVSKKTKRSLLAKKKRGIQVLKTFLVKMDAIESKIGEVRLLEKLKHS